MIKEIKSMEDHALAVSQVLALMDIEIEAGTNDWAKLHNDIYKLANIIEDFEEISIYPLGAKDFCYE